MTALYSSTTWEYHRRKLAGLAGAAVALVTMSVAAVPVAEEAKDPPVTRPARGATVENLRRWLGELRDGDPEVRERARIDLMGIDREALDDLQRVVVEMRPLAPSQLVALEEIVAHVYLSSTSPDPEGGGFLGVRLATTGVEIAPGPGVRAEGMPVGVAITSRLLGFDGYRMLQDGDVLLRLRTAKITKEFHQPMDLPSAVSSQPAGRTVILEVLRRGELIRVPVMLSGKPEWAAVTSADHPFGSLEREEKARAYWRERFAPLLDRGRQ